jgi:hypothetical protein
MSFKNWESLSLVKKKMIVILIFILIEISLKVGIALKDLINQICNSGK